MKLYHGSTEVIKKPMVIDTQRLLDFGMGFYTTSNVEQADNWARIKRRRNIESKSCFVSVYDFDDKILISSELKVKKFASANEEWLDFVVANRRGLIEHNYDIVIGAVANDTLYQTLTLYESGILTKEETILRLKTHLLFDQVSFHNEKALSFLKFLNSYQVS